MQVSASCESANISIVEAEQSTVPSTLHLLDSYVLAYRYSAPSVKCRSGIIQGALFAGHA